MIAAMGTAPRTEQHPAMPDPERVVSKSLGHLGRLGIGTPQSLYTITVVARRVAYELGWIGVDDTTWLEAIALAAEARLVPRPPSPTEQTESEHADGTGSRTGRTA